MPINAGSQFGRYEILFPLGAGGMGEVYCAKDIRLNRKVAIKFLSPTMVSDEQAQKRLEREAQAAAVLDHPNICAIYEVGREGDRPFIVMQYVEGETLAQHFHRGPLQLKETLDLAMQIADALTEAHSRGIIHRDIKPQNIMITKRGQAKLMDFGLARRSALGPGLESFAETQSILTSSGSMVGTLRYMSPEQIRGETVDARSDLFGLGAVLYEMVTGKRSFDAESPGETISEILTREPQPLSHFSPGTPDELQRIVGKALAKRKEDRYQTAKDIRIDLKNLRRALEHEPKLEPPPTLETKSVKKAATLPAHIPNQLENLAGLLRAPGVSFRDLTSSKILSPFRLGLSALVIVIVTFAAFGIYRLINPIGRRAINRVAVLPFVNESSDPNTEYLSDGLTESLIDSLSQLSKLQILARSTVFRFKGRSLDPQEVGRTLHVDAVITGRVLQYGDMLVISAELMHVASGTQLWGEQYNRQFADILVLQSEISSEISMKLRQRLTHEEQRRVTRHYTENTEAYQLYLKGRFYWNKRSGPGIRRSIEYFQQAIAKDPNYALAYTGLADSYIVAWVYSDISFKEAHQKSREAALKALEIDNTLAEAHSALASVLSDDWDFANSEKEHLRAIELNPNDSTIRQWYASFLIYTGRLSEALVEIKHAQELDPLSLVANTVLGYTYSKARQYDQAIQQLKKTIDMDRNFYLAHLHLGDVYEEKGMYPEAIVEHQTAEVLAGEHPEAAAKNAASLKGAYAASGVKGYWEKKLELKLEQSKHGHASPYSVAAICARLGKKELAIRWLEKAFQERDQYISLVRIDPEFDELRSDPRIIELMRHLGVPG